MSEEKEKPKEKARPEDRPLTLQQFKYCRALLMGKNKQAAAKIAGCGKGTGQNIWVSANVQKFLRDYYEKETAEIKLRRALVEERLFEAGMVDRSKAFEDNMKLKPLSKIPKALRRLIISARVFDNPEQGFSASAKFPNPVEALIAHSKLFPIPSEVQDHARDRAAEELEEDLDFLVKNLEEDLPE